jgi:rfaE bifunctional protein kinase chain/domain
VEPSEVGVLLASVDRCRVAVVGDVMIDVYAWGRVERISPEAPVPVVQVTHETMSPGGAANAAVCVAALGARATLFGTVGEDARAGQLESLLDAASVATAFARSASEPTITKQRIWSGAQQLLRLDS